jgi:hypothetical protein
MGRPVPGRLSARRGVDGEDQPAVFSCRSLYRGCGHFPQKFGDIILAGFFVSFLDILGQDVPSPIADPCSLDRRFCRKIQFIGK